MLTVGMRSNLRREGRWRSSVQATHPRPEIQSTHATLIVALVLAERHEPRLYLETVKVNSYSPASRRKAAVVAAGKSSAAHGLPPSETTQLQLKRSPSSSPESGSYEALSRTSPSATTFENEIVRSPPLMAATSSERATSTSTKSELL